LAFNPGGVDGTGSAARFASPQGIAVDAAGNVFVADTNNNAIRRIDTGSVVTTFAGQIGAPGASDGVGNTAHFNQPRGLAIDRNGNLFVADRGNQTIRKVTPAGGVSTVAGRPGLGCPPIDGYIPYGDDIRFCNPNAVAVDGSGTIWVAD